MSEPSASNKSVPFELMTSLVPDDVWARSPLRRESIDRVLAAPKLLITVPPTDATALGEAILRVLNDADLRAEMRERGFRQAQRFSWRTTAEQTLQAYRDAAAGR